MPEVSARPRRTSSLVGRDLSLDRGGDPAEEQLTPFEALRQDYTVNNDSLSRAVLTVYRFGRWSGQRRGPTAAIASILYRLLNGVVLRMLVGIDLPSQADVGSRTSPLHGGRGVAIHKRARIGSSVTLYQGVAIGTRDLDTDVPTVGDGVTVGCGAAILGSVVIGDGARIGAHALVLHDVPAGALALSPAAGLCLPD